MAVLGDIVIWIVMACAVAGAIASLVDEESGLGREFLEGIRAIGHIFIPVAGVMASIPFLSALIESVAGPLFAVVGADPAMAATTIIAVDMGGYQLADTLAQSRESWVVAMVTGYMAGATIVFSIPVGLAMLDKKDHPFMALGVMSGILSVPVGVFVTGALLVVTGPAIRPEAVTEGAPSHVLALSFGTLLVNLLPLLVFVALIAVGLRLVPAAMIRGFLVFGRVMDAAIKLVLVFCIVEHFTEFFSGVLGAWGFDPIVADDADKVRALEVAGYIGIMLAGAFPMVHLIRKHLAAPLTRLGERVGLEGPGAAGIVATIANILAMYRLVGEMRPRDKVLNIAFAVCAAFLFGDHLAFTANFQPTLVVPIMVGKVAGGVFAFALAVWISVPRAEAMRDGSRSV